MSFPLRYLGTVMNITFVLIARQKVQTHHCQHKTNYLKYLGTVMNITFVQIARQKVQTHHCQHKTNYLKYTRKIEMKPKHSRCRLITLPKCVCSPRTSSSLFSFQNCFPKTQLVPSCHNCFPYPNCIIIISLVSQVCSHQQ